MYSLWRGNELIGHINPELPHDEASVVFGVLQPSAAFIPGQAIMQHTLTGVPGAPVFQHTTVLTGIETNTSDRQVSSSAARPLSELLRDSVPIHSQLLLKNSDDRVVGTRTISIMAMPRGGQSIQQLCKDSGVDFSGWCVVAAMWNGEDDDS